MAATDKTKLDGVATGANLYTHPANHAPSVITQDASNRFVTDTEKSTWNAKAGTAVATTSVNGLMAATDKTKLDGVATGANNYAPPTNCTLSNDWNAIAATGSYYNSLSTATGIPVTSSYMLLFHQQVSSVYASQMCCTTAGDQIWYRKKTSSTWSAWVEFYHTGNLTNADEYSSGLMDNYDKIKMDRMTGIKVTYSATEPINPQFGDIWIKS
jgi:hypothetical protein